MAVDPRHYEISVSSRYSKLNEVDVTTSNLVETPDGDFIIGADGELLIANQSEDLTQLALYAIKTKFNSSEVLGIFGCRLEETIGSLMNPTTLTRATSQLERDLETSGVPVVEGSIEILPLNDQQIAVTLELALPTSEVVTQTYKFDTATYAIELLTGQQT